MLQRKQQFMLVRKHTADSLSPQDAALLVSAERSFVDKKNSISITEVHVTLNHPPAKHFLHSWSLQAYVAN